MIRRPPRSTLFPYTRSSDLNLQRIGSAADQDVRRATGFRLHDGARPFRGDDRFAPRPAQKACERQVFARETPHATESRLLAWVRERRNQLARGLVALAANAQAAVNDLLQVITAGQRADIAAANRAGDVTTKEHHSNQPDLVDVVALLPASHPPPCDLVWYVEQVERIGGDAATAELGCRDPKVAELELLVFAHEHVERRQGSGGGP